MRVEGVEGAVSKLPASYELDLEQRSTLRDRIHSWFTENASQGEADVRTQRQRVEKLERRREKVKDAYFADAPDVVELKVEQQRINRELLEAETIIQRHVAQLSDIDRGIVATLLLLTRPGDFYAGGLRAIQRLMVQELIDRIWSVDHRVAGADLRRPFWQRRS